jgi:hypothetical protein
MGAFNPYSKSPDFGSWGQDTAMNIMQWLMMKQMFGNTGGTPQVGQTPLPPQSGAASMGAQNMAQMAPGLGQQNTPGQPQQGGMDYAKLMQIMAMLGQRR